ncbi:hypothetical protein PPACK8108_LOCUS8693 [Phakopsora pachyrhizi]|uniref:Uncharacterized protein n=1 Tax=Phakopsora pachyrhizi TaxID=170000 RepID=A0AAV0AXJ9_PHAPC|nr:hypothetical protein PPACK8108_LOCUS8693 [Phakopsora pachyrhizi]
MLSSPAGVICLGGDHQGLKGLLVESRAGRGLAWQGWVQGLVGRAGRGLAWLGLAGTKLRPVLKPERQAEGFWVKADERLVRDVDHVAVVEKASFKSGCDFDTKVVQGVMWH